MAVLTSSLFRLLLLRFRNPTYLPKLFPCCTATLVPNFSSELDLHYGPNRIKQAIEEDASSGVEFLQVQGGVIAVEEEAVDGVGTDTASNVVGGFEEEERGAGGVEVGGGGESS